MSCAKAPQAPCLSQGFWPQAVSHTRSTWEGVGSVQPAFAQTQKRKRARKLPIGIGAKLCSASGPAALSNLGQKPYDWQVEWYRCSVESRAKLLQHATACQPQAAALVPKATGKPKVAPKRNKRNKAGPKLHRLPVATAAVEQDNTKQDPPTLSLKRGGAREGWLAPKYNQSFILISISSYDDCYHHSHRHHHHPYHHLFPILLSLSSLSSWSSSSLIKQHWRCRGC